MGIVRVGRLACALGALVVGGAVRSAQAEKLFPFIFPEQRTIEIRDPSELRPAPIPNTPPPATVSQPLVDAPERLLSLDEAIRTGLANSEVVRVLNGVSARTTGRTIYDTAIENNAIDEAQAAFDPTLRVNNGFNRFERPGGVDASDPANPVISGTRTDNYGFELDLDKRTITGGTFNFGINETPTRNPRTIFDLLDPQAAFLNPRTPSSTELSYTQPLLQGGGWTVNRAPIVIARIETERSYFQFKDSVQNLVRSVIEAYWSLVFARTDVWARRQQVQQAKGALDLAEARLRAGVTDLGDVAQARTAYYNFRGSLVTAEASLLQREAALRNLLGFPPYDPEQTIPITPPRQERIEPDWHEIIALAQERRPDLIELKLIQEADQQRLLQARNQALPQLDAIALYRWNGLEGELPLGQVLSSEPGQFTDWTLAVNFSVPLGLRQSRANLRQFELILARNEANLQQGVHAASHDLAESLRNLAQSYAEYEAFREARAAARLNLERQYAEYRNGRTILLNLLQAITAWGDAVSAEARSLLQYNTGLANLEQQTGTILETHGVRFFEERFGSIGPLGRLCRDACYPAALPPTLNFDRYPVGEQPSEQAFDLQVPEFPTRRRSTPNEAIPTPLP